MMVVCADMKEGFCCPSLVCIKERTVEIEIEKMLFDILYFSVGPDCDGMKEVLALVSKINSITKWGIVTV